MRFTMRVEWGTVDDVIHEWIAYVTSGARTYFFPGLADSGPHEPQLRNKQT